MKLPKPKSKEWINAVCTKCSALVMFQSPRKVIFCDTCGTKLHVAQEPKSPSKPKSEEMDERGRRLFEYWFSNTLTNDERLSVDAAIANAVAEERERIVGKLDEIKVVEPVGDVDGLKDKRQIYIAGQITILLRVQELCDTLDIITNDHE